MTNQFAFRLSLLGFITLGSLVVHDVAHAASRAATGRAQIRKPITLVNTADLNFGTIIRGTTAGTVTINAATGARTKTGGVVLAGTGFTPAAFTATGTGNKIVTMTAGATTISLSNGTQTMTVNTLRIRAGTGAAQTLPRNYTLPVSGNQTFNLAGRLNVAANQADGAYSGSFTLTLNYQ